MPGGLECSRWGRLVRWVCSSAEVGWREPREPGEVLGVDVKPQVEGTVKRQEAQGLAPQWTGGDEARMRQEDSETQVMVSEAPA